MDFMANSNMKLIVLEFRLKPVIMKLHQASMNVLLFLKKQMWLSITTSC